MKNTKIIETKVLCKEAGRYIGWPSITKAKNGDILAVFSGDRYGHVCMAGKTQMVRSKDGGKSWGDPETITNTPLDDRDAGIITLADGTLLVSWFISYFHPDNPRINKWDLENSWRPYIEKITEEDKKKWLGKKKSDDSLEWTSGNWIRTSKDHGYTWDEPVKVVASSPHGPIELSDASLMYLGNGEYKGEDCIVSEKSYDGGKTWRVEYAFPRMINKGELWEAHAVEVDKNRIVGMFRYEYPVRTRKGYMDDEVLWQAESFDGGKTWNQPRPTEIWGHPPHVIKTKENILVMVYGYRRPPFGERACLSFDGGETWDYKNEIILSAAPDGDLGYPASVELEDGTIISVYYEKDKIDEKPCLKATYWKII